MTSAFHVPSTILIGGGARREVVAQLQRFQIQRVLLVTDAEGYEAIRPLLPADAKIVEHLWEVEAAR